MCTLLCFQTFLIYVHVLLLCVFDLVYSNTFNFYFIIIVIIIIIVVINIIVIMMTLSQMTQWTLHGFRLVDAGISERWFHVDLALSIFIYLMTMSWCLLYHVDLSFFKPLLSRSPFSICLFQYFINCRVLVFFHLAFCLHAKPFCLLYVNSF